MKQVIIYPGRFQPMLSHHAEVYRQLQLQFPDADVYVGTSDKVEGEKSPFNFKEKQQIAQAHGIDPSKVLLAKRPYHKDEYPFDENNTVIIFAVGEKDLDRFPFSNVDPKTGLDMTVRGDAKPKYYQKINTYRTDPKPMAERGYITLAPTVKTGDEVASASAFRSALKNAPDVDSAKDIFTTQFGQFDQKVFDLIHNKIKGTEMSEQLNVLRKLAGLEPVTEAPVQMPDFDKGERPKTPKEREAYRAWKKSQSASAKGDDNSPLAPSSKEKKDAAERPAKAAAADPTKATFTKIKPEDMVDKRSGKPIPSSQRHKSLANQIPADADVNDPAVKKEIFLKMAAKRPDLVFGEINARLANDEAGLAMSDRLSPIVRELEDSRNIMELDAEDKKFALKLLQNAIDNMELVRSTEHDKAIDVEPMQLDVDDEDEPELGDDEMAPVLDIDDEPVRDSINFDDIRAEYGVEEAGRGSKALMPGGKLIIGKGEVAFHDDYGWMARGWGDDDFEYFDSEQQARDYVEQEYKRRKEISKQVDNDPEEDEWERRARHLANEPRVSAPRFKDDDDNDFEEGIEDKVCPHCDGSGCEECDDVGGTLDEGENSVEAIVNKHGGAEQVKKYLDGEEFYGTPMFDELYSYYSSNNEMPYGTATGDTGEPDVWILDQLDDEYSTMEAMDETVDNAMSAAMAELRKLAGI